MRDEMDPVWYTAFKAKDARFDGRIFVGVSSTGIYCRPVCRARLPKIENCRFFVTAALAEQAGYRPCLLCRPELAPGASPMDTAHALAHRVAKFLEAHCGSEQRIEHIAARFGCTPRHLRRAFAAEYRVSPLQYLQTCRLLLAKRLLADTDLSVIDVAMAAGFGSVRRFNALFRKRYALVPTALRRRAKEAREGARDIALTLGYRPPYAWQKILDFLAVRAIPGVETVRDGEYIRTVRFAAKDRTTLCGWIRVGHRPQHNALSVAVDAALLPVLSQVLAGVRRLFDLDCDPDAVYEALSSMNTLRPGLCMPGVRLPGCLDTFEMAVRAVLGQQITVKAAGTLAARLVEAFGTTIHTGIEDVTKVFPSPQDILALGEPIDRHLGPLGITAARANTILALARKMAQGEVDFGCSVQPDLEMKKLMAIPGIGPWTAHYIALRAMNWPDAFPHTDYGVKKALAPRTPAEILALAETWRPWRGYATINLWNAL